MSKQEELKSIIIELVDSSCGLIDELKTRCNRDNICSCVSKIYCVLERIEDAFDIDDEDLFIDEVKEVEAIIESMKNTIQ